MVASDAACQTRDKGSGMEVCSDSSPPSHPSTRSRSLTSRLDYGWPRSARATNGAARSLFLPLSCSHFSPCHSFSPLTCTFFHLHLHLLPISFHLFPLVLLYFSALLAPPPLSLFFLLYSLSSVSFSLSALSLRLVSSFLTRLFSSTSVTLVTSQHLSNPIIALLSFHLIFPASAISPVFCHTY